LRKGPYSTVWLGCREYGRDRLAHVGQLTMPSLPPGTLRAIVDLTHARVNLTHESQLKRARVNLSAGESTQGSLRGTKESTSTLRTRAPRTTIDESQDSDHAFLPPGNLRVRVNATHARVNLARESQLKRAKVNLTHARVNSTHASQLNSRESQLNAREST
jgi:hypothetical protein